jgi:hypothetical protein
MNQVDAPNRILTSGEKTDKDLLASLERTAEELRTLEPALPPRIDANPDEVERGLAKLVLTLIELLRRLLEKQAIRRIDSGSLTDEEIERLGMTFLRLHQRMRELQGAFSLTEEDLNLNLGPLGDLM